mgnify:CR=1 FL=1
MTASEVERLRAALQAIADFEPSDELPEITHNPESCRECKTLKAWATQKGTAGVRGERCDVWYREYYRREDARRRAQDSQHVDMRRIAREALRWSWAIGVASNDEHSGPAMGGADIRRS